MIEQDGILSIPPILKKWYEGHKRVYTPDGFYLGRDIALGRKEIENHWPAFIAGGIVGFYTDRSLMGFIGGAVSFTFVEKKAESIVVDTFNTLINKLKSRENVLVRKD